MPIYQFSPDLRAIFTVSASEGRSADSFYNCTMPFTRLAIGPADYAPLASFSNAEVDWIPGGVPEMYLNTTYAAMAAHADMFCAFPWVYRCREDQSAYDFPPLISQDHSEASPYPAEWDETVLVGQNKIGEYVNMARRSGENWYMGIMCNDPYEYGTTCLYSGYFAVFYGCDLCFITSPGKRLPCCSFRFYICCQRNAVPGR